jgi:hypothetical protein
MSINYHFPYFNDLLHGMQNNNSLCGDPPGSEALDLSIPMEQDDVDQTNF